MVTDYLIPISLLPDVVHHFELCIMLDKKSLSLLFKPPGCKDKGIIRLEIVASTYRCVLKLAIF